MTMNCSIPSASVTERARIHSSPAKGQEKIGKIKNDMRNLASKVVSIKKSYKKVKVSYLSCWVQSCRSLHNYFFKGNNNGQENKSS